MEMPNHLQYKFLLGGTPQTEPQSAYVAVYHKGQVWHLFNANRINLGRMAEKIAILIRGKHKPHYAPNRFDLGDKCVVVNASKLRVSGKQKHWKMFRHHTGYSGGLKEIVMKDLIKKDVEQVVYRTVRGMLPHNTIREHIMANLIVHEGPYHTQFAQKLP